MKHAIAFRNPLISASSPHNTRYIGILVSSAYTHMGFNPPRQVVEIESEFPALITRSSVKLAVPADRWKGEAADSLENVLVYVDAQAAELKAHGESLRSALKRLRQRQTKQDAS